MVLIQIIGFGFVTALAALLLKSTKPELSLAVTIVGGILILLSAFELLEDSLSILKKIAEISSLSSILIKTLIKIVGIGYITEFSAGILQDFGSNSVADKVVFGGKIIIFTLTLPIVEKLLELVLSFLSLL